MRQFSKHLALASEATFHNVSSVRRSEVDDGFDFTFHHESLESPVDIQVVIQDATGYLTDAKFMAFTGSECLSHLTESIEALSSRIPGDSTVGDAISFLSKGLLAALIDDDNVSDFFDESGLYDDSFADLGFGLLSSPSRSGSRQATNLLKKSLQKAHSAGLHIAIFPPVPAPMPEAVSLSIQVKQLGLSDDAQEAWDLEPDEYLVLIFRPVHGYPSLSAYLELGVDQRELRFRFGKCATAQPSFQTIRKALWLFTAGTGTGIDRGVQLEHRGQDACFLPNHMSASIDRLLNNHLHVLLGLRRRHKLSWTSAQKMMQETERDPRRRAFASRQNGKKEAPISSQAPAALQRDYALDEDDEFSIPLVAMQLALRHLVRCTEFCTVCHDKLGDSTNSMKPYACDNRLCLYQHLSLGFGASLEHQVVHQPYVVDLLLSFFYAAVHGEQLREFPTGFALKVSTPQDPASGIECDFSVTGRQSGSVRALSRTPIGRPGRHFVVAVVDAVGDLKYYACCIADVKDGFCTFHMLSGPHKIKSFDTEPTLQMLLGRVSKADDGWDKALVFPSIHEVEGLPKDQRNLALMLIMLAMPSVLSMRSFLLAQPGERLSEFSYVSRSALSLAEWVLATNKSHLIQDQPVSNEPLEKSRPELKIGNLMRFRFAQGAPDKERYFMDELERHGNPRREWSTLFAWHGSPLGNWHSIVRSGLDFENQVNGRTYGHGVYVSQDMGRSITYSMHSSPSSLYTDSLPQHWPQSDLQPSKALSLVEVINRPDLFVSNHPHFVINNVNWIQCRYLYVEVSPTAMALKEPSPGRQIKESRASAPQDCDRCLLNLDRELFRVPIEAVPACRRAERAGPAAAGLFRTPKQTSQPERRADDKADDVLALLRFPDEESKVDARGSKRVRDAAPSPSPDERAASVPKTTPDGAVEFRPGSLDHSSLPRLPAPSWADSSPQAQKALGKELKNVYQIQKETPARELGWFVDVEKTDNLFHWIAELHSFDADLPLAQDMARRGISSVVLEIRFGANFPMAPPFVRVVRPRFLPFGKGGGGHVTVGGAVCSEMLTLSGWLPGLTMETVLLQVRLGLCDRDVPARLDASSASISAADYGVGEAVEAYRRAARKHGWMPSPDLGQLAAMDGPVIGSRLRL